MKVTLSDIAKETGFSISTISRTLRGNGKVSKENERTVLEAAQRLNYPVSKILRYQKSRKDLFIAIVTQFHTGEFYTSFFNGFLSSANKRNINIGLLSLSDQIDTFINKLNLKGYSAAVLFAPGLQTDDYIKILKNTPIDFPVISCSNNAQPVIDTITFDAYRGASLVAEHFKQQGYETVGMIEGPGETQPEARFRKNGFVDYISHHKNIDFIWSYPGNYKLCSGISAFEEFEKLKNKPRAIFAANDETAIGFMETAIAAGYKFPNDIAIAGFDNLPMCSFHYPSLTSVVTDYTQLADLAFSKVMERLNSHKSHQGVVNLLPVKLVVRHSS